MSPPPEAKTEEIQVPLAVMRELLGEFRSANEKFEKVAQLGENVDSLERAIKGLTEKLDKVIHTLHGDGNSHSTRLALLEQKMKQRDTGWQRWMEMFGSLCGAIALIVAAMVGAQ